MRYLFIILFICSSVLAQNGHRIHRYKFYDTTDFKNQIANGEKYKNRRLTIDVDSTGIAMRAWDTECFFKINLLGQGQRNYRSRGQRNGQPHIRYGNNKTDFSIYINESGNFEYDIIFDEADGQYEVSADIQIQNLKLLFQPPLTQEVKDMEGEYARPDSLINSWAIYHINGRHNIKYPDGREKNYRTGKMTHLYTPKVWDANGDTVWGYIRFDTVGLKVIGPLANGDLRLEPPTENVPVMTKMTVGVDSTWKANAVHPVTVDPNWGYESVGGTSQNLANFMRGFDYEDSPSDAGGGTLTSVTFYQFTLTAADGSLIVWALYSDASSDPTTRLAFQSTGKSLASANDASWITCDASFSSYSLVANTTYHFVSLTDIATSNQLVVRYDSDAGGPQENSTSATTYTSYPTFPATATGFNFNNGRAVSVYGTYTVSGGADPSTRRRKVILGGN